MLFTGPVGVSFKTAVTGVCAKMAADLTLTPTQRAFATEYGTRLATKNTSYEQDAQMLTLFTQWWINNMKTQTSDISV